jgi:hypothetical protein
MPWKIPTTSLFPIATASVTVLAIMKSSSFVHPRLALGSFLFPSLPLSLHSIVSLD